MHSCMQLTINLIIIIALILKEVPVYNVNVCIFYLKNVARYPVQNNSAGSIKGSENIYPMFTFMSGGM